MKNATVIVCILVLCSSCSYIAGPEGIFPSKEYDFLEEVIEDEISLPDDLKLVDKENHFPIGKYL